MYSELFEALPDALLLVDRKGEILRANLQAETLFGYPAGGLLGLPIEQLMPEGMRARHREHRAGYVHAPRVRAMGDTGMALVGQRRDGRQFPLEIALSPVVMDSRTCVLASVRDVSETFRARQALVRARYDALVARIGRAALEASTEDALLAGLPMLLSEALDAEQVVVLVRGIEPPRVYAKTVLPSDEVALLQGEGLALVQGERIVVIDDRTTDARRFPLPRREGSGAAVALVARDRPAGLLLAWSRQPHHFDHDALHLLESVATLVSALVQRQAAEEQLAHAQRLDAIGQLTGGIAHDFNNLLTVVSGSLQLLQAECADRRETTELIEMAAHAVEGGAELTGKLLAFARRQRLSPSAIHPDQILAGLAPMLQRTLGDSIRLSARSHAALPAAFADRAQLEAALLNLALNARDAMPEGGALALAADERWIPVTERRPGVPPGHYIVFSVVDSGIGMSPETRARAIEPFFTTKGPGRGSGLGLSMVYGFVVQSGGHLQIESDVGKGTRVELYLPVGHPAATPVTADSAPESETETGQSVLVVEDEPSVRRIAAAFVESLGYRVCAAATAEEALDLLDARPDVALLFTDVMLGIGMHGKELARRARTRRPGLAVLLATGYDNVPGGESDAGDDTLRKPYTRPQLAQAMRRALSRARS